MLDRFVRPACLLIKCAEHADSVKVRGIFVDDPSINRDRGSYPALIYEQLGLAQHIFFRNLHIPTPNGSIKFTTRLVTSDVPPDQRCKSPYRRPLASPELVNFDGVFGQADRQIALR